MVRDVLNSLRSEEFYVSEKRFAKAADGTEKQIQVRTDSPDDPAYAVKITIENSVLFPAITH